MLPWSPLAGGLLSGKFDPEKKGPADARRSSSDFPPVHMERLPPVRSALRQVAEQTGSSVARVALAWQLTKPFVTSIIIGAKKKAEAARCRRRPRERHVSDRTLSIREAAAETGVTAHTLRYYELHALHDQASGPRVG